jgi:hypothetical protein
VPLCNRGSLFRSDNHELPLSQSMFADELHSEPRQWATCRAGCPRRRMSARSSIAPPAYAALADWTALPALPSCSRGSRGPLPQAGHWHSRSSLRAQLSHNGCPESCERQRHSEFNNLDCQMALNAISAKDILRCCQISGIMIFSDHSFWYRQVFSAAQQLRTIDAAR